MRLSRTILICVLFFISSCSSILTSPGDSGTLITKSPNDTRNYKYLTLSNQLEVFLVSDPSTDQAAVSLDVLAGHNFDPPTRQGLAHFLEHMLFLGTDKYPQAEEYGSYLSAHGGYSNAYTSYEDTNYYFSIHKDYLDGALDRFSQFFISPRFDARFVERELNAVNAEHQKNIQNDMRRIHRILKEISNPIHPYHNFGTGNLETLKGDDDRNLLRSQLIDFFEKHYSSNVMKLVIVGKETLPELEALARKYFSGIRNKNLVVESFSHIPLFDDVFPRKVTIKPVKAMRQLRLMFPIPPQRKLYKNKPSEVISHLIGDEGIGSILAKLREKGWATSLSAGAGPGSRDFSFLDINIVLTNQGLNRVDDVVQLIFQYIDLIKKEKSLERIFNESKKMAAIGFQFKDKEDPVEYARFLAARLQDIPGNDVLAARWLYKEYKPEMVNEILQYLTPENLQLILIAPNVSTDKVEKWYQANYAVNQVSKKTIEFWKKPSVNNALKLPPENPFIPEKITLKEVQVVDLYPVLMKNNAMSRVWFKQDDRFRVPKGNIRIQLSTPKAYESVKNAAMTRLFLMLLIKNLNEYSYPASLAGLDYSISNSVKGINLYLGGYSENIHLLFKKIVDEMVGFQSDPQNFKIFKNQIREKRQNQKLSPAYQRISYEAYYFLSDPFWHTDEYLDAIEDISLEDVLAFVPQLLSQMFIEIFAHGNFDVNEILSLNAILEQNFTNPKLKPVLQVEERTAQIVSPTNVTYQMEVEDVNSAVDVYFQVGPESVEQSVTLDMIQQILEKPFYHQLRTIEQLGYLVWSGYRSSNKVDGFNFIIQSSSREPVYLQERIDNFIKNFKTDLNKISKDQFEQFRESLIARREELPKNLEEETQRYWGAITSTRFDFQNRDKEIEALKRLTLDDVKRAYTEIFLMPSNTKRVNIQAIGKNHQRLKPSGTVIKDLKEYRRNITYYSNPPGEIKTHLYRN